MKLNKKLQNHVPDYAFCCSKGTSAEEREKLNIGDWWINGVVCLECKDFIRSRNRHDYRSCSCGNVSVDGGSHYLRRSFKRGTFVDVSEPFGDLDGTKLTPKEFKNL